LDIDSKTPCLQEEALAVFSIAFRNLIEPEWIPCLENQQADYLNRIQDKDDRSIRPEVFSYIDAL